MNCHISGYALHHLGQHIKLLRQIDDILEEHEHRASQFEGKIV